MKQNQRDINTMNRMCFHAMDYVSGEITIWESMLILIEREIIPTYNKDIDHIPVSMQEVMHNKNCLDYVMGYYYLKLLGKSSDMLLDGEEILFIYRLMSKLNPNWKKPRRHKICLKSNDMIEHNIDCIRDNGGK